MESRYFKRDISWLSFNYRVLLEAEDDTLPLYERINFISIYSSNLEEFYKIRVADHKAIATGAAHSDEESVQSAMQLVTEINEEVNRQLEERIRIYEQKILPALRQHHIIFYQSRNVEPFHKEFLRRFFREEIFPYLSPVPVSKDKVISFLRDNRLYLAVRLHSKGTLPGDPDHTQYFVMKLPYSKVPRFIELPKQDKNYYLMFIEDIIKANIDTIFPGYDVDSSYCIKISRDADILIDESANTSEIIEQVKTKVKKRKIGAVCRFVYDRAMPDDFLDFLVDAFRINRQELVPGDKHLNMEDLRHLPNPNNAVRPIRKPQPMKLACLDERESIFRYVEKKDLLLHYPYHSFEHFIHFLYEAVHEPTVREIMVTQYRVAENSAVINTLIAAAQNGKKVTVFVELKARFDEENNIVWARMLEKAGCHVIYGLVGLKTHSKITLVVRREEDGIRRYVHLGTGNYNDATAKLYTDVGMLTCAERIGEDATAVFNMLSGYSEPLFWNKLALAPLWLKDKFLHLIEREKNYALEGKNAHIIAKMNSLCDKDIIRALYEASAAGVKIELIVRGICCLKVGIPGVSENISVRSIVGNFLEHSRIFYFANDDHYEIYCGSADWMPRNLERRVEILFPVDRPELKEELLHILNSQLKDNVKASILQPDGSYEKQDKRGKQLFNSQDAFCLEAIQKAKEAAGESAIESRTFIPETHHE